jgi:hypothetical protein
MMQHQAQHLHVLALAGLADARFQQPAQRQLHRASHLFLHLRPLFPSLRRVLPRIDELHDDCPLLASNQAAAA